MRTDKDVTLVGTKEKKKVMLNETSCSSSLMCNVIEVEKKKVYIYIYKDHLFLSFSQDQADSFILFEMIRIHLLTLPRLFFKA